MRNWMLFIVIFSGSARAEEPCCCEPDPVIREELISAAVIFAVGQTVAYAAQIAVPSTPVQRVFDTVPIFGSVDAAVRSENWEARMTLIFATGVQIVGVLMAVTAAVVHMEPKRVGFNANGVTVHF